MLLLVHCAVLGKARISRKSRISRTLVSAFPHPYVSLITRGSLGLAARQRSLTTRIECELQLVLSFVFLCFSASLRANSSFPAKTQRGRESSECARYFCVTREIRKISKNQEQ